MPLLLLLLASRPAAAAQWTVGIYMCADNGMNDQSYVDLAEMKTIGSTEEVNVVVQVDNAARDTHPGCRRYYVGKDRLDDLGELGAIDMADPQTLGDFARFLKERYPAPNYFVVLWDHGTGWTLGGDGRSRYIFIDDSHDDRMSVAGGRFGAALALVHQALGTRVRVLGFDACMMGMVEVARAAMPHCDYMAASEGLVPWDGWDYSRFLGGLCARPTQTPAELLAALSSEYVDGYSGEDVCFSGTDLRRLEQVLPRLAAVVRDSVDPAAAVTRSARAAAQTFAPVSGRPPAPGDDQLDLADFLRRAQGGPGAAAALESAVVANAHSGSLGNARGLATWFPEHYLAFKDLAPLYDSLDYAHEVAWLPFLDRYYGSDDVKPATPAILTSRPGGRGDIRFLWSRSADWAPVRYDLYEVTGPREVFSDDCEDLDNWMNYGWVDTTSQAHSGSRSFFSGGAPNLDNWLEAVAPLDLAQGGLLSLYAWFSTPETEDSAGNIRHDAAFIEWSPDRQHWQPVDSLYGSAAAWQERRYVLPPSAATFLRFRYVSGPNNNGTGCFLDDIKVYAFDTMRVAVRATAETTGYVFNLARDTGGYCYFVTATDSFGNVSLASQFAKVAVKTWAEPYTRPAPFSGACQLCLDFPAGLTPDVLIYTLSGTLVRRLDHVTDRVLAWDGCNQAGRPLADGLYIVAVQGTGFRKLGKIARVRR